MILNHRGQVQGYARAEQREEKGLNPGSDKRRKGGSKRTEGELSDLRFSKTSSFPRPVKMSHPVPPPKL